MRAVAGVVLELALIALFPVMVVLAIPALPYLLARRAYDWIDDVTQRGGCS